MSQNFPIVCIYFKHCVLAGFVILLFFFLLLLYSTTLLLRLPTVCCDIGNDIISKKLLLFSSSSLSSFLSWSKCNGGAVVGGLGICPWYRPRILILFCCVSCWNAKQQEEVVEENNDDNHTTPTTMMLMLTDKEEDVVDNDRRVMMIVPTNKADEWNKSTDGCYDNVKKMTWERKKLSNAFFFFGLPFVGLLVTLFCSFGLHGSMTIGFFLLMAFVNGFLISNFALLPVACCFQLLLCSSRCSLAGLLQPLLPSTKGTHCLSLVAVPQRRIQYGSSKAVRLVFLIKGVFVSQAGTLIKWP